MGGPGEFDVTAGSISLGNSYGILSLGVGDTTGGFDRYGNLASITPAAAAIDVTVNDYGTATANGDLDMQTSAIANLGGGGISVFAEGSMDLGSADLFNTKRQVGLAFLLPAKAMSRSLRTGTLTLTAHASRPMTVVIFLWNPTTAAWMLAAAVIPHRRLSHLCGSRNGSGR